MLLSDHEIKDLLRSEKPHVDSRELLQRLQRATSINNGHRRAEQEVFDAEGRRFVIKLRQSLLDPEDFWPS